MIRNRLWAVLICLSLSAAARAADSGCGPGKGVCQDQLISPPALEPSQPSPRIQDPETSALAPIPSPVHASPVKIGPETRHAIANNHDSDLFVIPSKPKVSTDPFGPGSTRHLRFYPEQP